MPLVVALHGAFGFGQDFLWTWLRETRTRGCLLLAPTSTDTTWSLDAPGRDAARLASMLAFVRGRWPVDPAHILLTGLSDGGTFALLAGLLEESPYTHIASVSGVLHPANFALGNVARSRGRPIRIVHGALDWLFPVALARAAHDALRAAGAAVVYRELPDCSHTWPREENARILRWMDPSLTLPGETT
jgi:phospholipase/carboxylesterase